MISRNKWIKKAASLLLMLLMTLFFVTGCAGSAANSGTLKEDPSKSTRTAQEVTQPKEDGEQCGDILEEQAYYSKEDVAAYLYLYGHLPDNFITKSEAKELGWVSNKGNLWDVAPGKCIGGDRFGNREKLLPEKDGRKYFECDTDYEGGYRGSGRIIYSSDGLIYYTEDHYNSFDLLYTKEGKQ